MAVKNKKSLPISEWLISLLNSTVGKIISIGTIASGLIWIGTFAQGIAKDNEISDIKAELRKEIFDTRENLKNCQEEGRELKYKNYILEINNNKNEQSGKK